MNTSVLIVESDPLITHDVQKLFHSNYYHCATSNNLEKSYDLLAKNSYDLVIADKILADGDGLELTEYLSESHFPTRTLLLLKSFSEEERILCLAKGADDCIPKPFSHQELQLKVKKLLHTRKLQSSELYSLGKLAFDPSNGRLFMQARQTKLRRKESEILTCLFHYKNSVVTREMIINHVWTGEQPIPTHTTLDVYIRRIRLQLYEYSQYLQTVRGFGYCLYEPPTLPARQKPDG